MTIDDLNLIEKEMQSLWTAEGATPFLADLRLTDELFTSARRAARQYSIGLLLTRFPTLGVWAVLYPLSKNYSAKDRDVYPHLEEFLKEPLQNEGRRNLKAVFITAARRIGIPVVSSTDPTAVFFAPLGAPEPQHSNLAKAFILRALQKGPPAIEDTVASRHWQRLAVINYCSGQPRLIAPIRFDESAHYARRFDAWRRGASGVGAGEISLFEAYDTFASRMGQKRSDFVGPPLVIWHRNGLGLLPETSSKSQSIKDGLFPRQIPGGKRTSITAPWPDTIKWIAGPANIDVAFAPVENEVMIFDADSGALLQRVNEAIDQVEVPATRLIALSKTNFNASGFGEAIPTADPAVLSAWIEAGEMLTFSDRSPLQITAPIDTAIWFDGTVLGRNGTSALYANDLKVFMRLDPAVGGIERILRAQIGTASRYRSICIDAKNEASITFDDFGFAPDNNPGKITFEVLVPGAAGELTARADLKATSWVWAGVPPPPGDLENVRVPSNYVPARSSGLHIDSFDRLSVDSRSDVETPILGLKFEEKTFEFDLVARSEKLWHFRIASNDQVFVPKGGTVTFGYDNRHDMLRLRCHDRNADLIVLGKQINRPFIQRQIFEIGAEKLEVDTGDDRIAIRRSDGRLDLLARLRRVVDAGSLSLREDDNTVVLTFRPHDEVDALRVHVEKVEKDTDTGDYAFGVLPASLPPLPGILTTRDQATKLITVRVDKTQVAGPARITFETISAAGALEPVRDGSRSPVAVGLAGSVPFADRAAVIKLAAMLADPEPEELNGQVSKTLYPVYAQAFEALSTNRIVGAVKPILNVTRRGGGTARHDIVGVAPWVFEAGAHALSGLSEGTGFAGLDLMRSIHAPDPLPDLEAQHPLGAWLSRLQEDSDIPNGLTAEALNTAFVDLRFRLNETDMADLTGGGALGNACRIICGTHAEHLNKLRDFDTGGGGDPTPAKIAMQIERFARACAEKRSEEFLRDLILRTGLSRQDIGHTLTMMLRAGVQFFVYFRVLWGHATT
ncbi:hypothetical protein [Thioclava sp. F36-6]|uniref:hypothetical protein n=1 Tax=Thioclava sp. F36-6 TaxID=1915316 RepID=UPI000998BEBF|nr:hypothetical protein [Thioclava sp. F36-6]OOY31105.1 hypothetical protein BMI88_08145 [Thioclava sp. F36-6]